MLRSQPWVKFISVTQNDNIRFCQDPEELAIIEDDGGAVIAPMLRAVNQIADAVKDEFPHVLVRRRIRCVHTFITGMSRNEFGNPQVDTFAYGNALNPPTKTVPRDNVVIRICTAECNFAAPLTDPVNLNLANNISEWGKIAKQTTMCVCGHPINCVAVDCSRRLSIRVVERSWDYTTNFLYMPSPFPDWCVAFRDSSVGGLYFWPVSSEFSFATRNSVLTIINTTTKVRSRPESSVFGKTRWHGWL